MLLNCLTFGNNIIWLIVGLDFKLSKWFTIKAAPLFSLLYSTELSYGELVASILWVKVIYRKCLNHISRRSVGPNGSNIPVFSIIKFFGYKPSPLSLYTAQLWSKLMLWMSLMTGALTLPSKSRLTKKYTVLSHYNSS